MKVVSRVESFWSHGHLVEVEVEVEVEVVIEVSCA
jgi:hypothetical protein